MAKVMTHKKQLLNELGDVTNAQVLDYGCGAGDFIELLLAIPNQPKLVFAVDSSKDMLEKIQSNFSDAIDSGIIITEICSSPSELHGNQFDKIICHNVLECVDNKIAFINHFDHILKPGGVFVLSHHDFDSSLYNSHYKDLTRHLVHHFADTQQAWQAHCDGQMGRKIPSLVEASVFKNKAVCKTWRIVERDFKPGNYGFLMAEMLIDGAMGAFDEKDLQLWRSDLQLKSDTGHYYFAIDLNVAVLG